MKKMTKLSLDELAETFPVLTKEEMQSCWGGYVEDCFWRCLAYIKTGGQYFDEVDAERLAKDYYCSKKGWSEERADKYLRRHGAGMTTSGVQSYLQWATLSGFYNLSDASGIYYIGATYTSNLTGYESGDFHAIIVRRNPDGTLYYYDAQQGVEAHVEDPSLVTKVMYF